MKSFSIADYEEVPITLDEDVDNDVLDRLAYLENQLIGRREDWSFSSHVVVFGMGFVFGLLTMALLMTHVPWGF